MKLKVFTLRFSGSPEGFDDRPLQEFIADKEVIEFSEHFFTRDNTPYLTILIAYRPLTEDGARRPVPQRDLRNEFDAREKFQKIRGNMPLPSLVVFVYNV